MASGTLQDPFTLFLGLDPENRQWLLNGTSSQQDILISFRGWQYGAFYASLSYGKSSDPIYIHLARRRLTQSEWEIFAFEDYPQTTDDGHNSIQIGICYGDGTIHLAFDHHSDRLKYRYSQRDVATDPEHIVWSSSLFTQTTDTLLGTIAPIDDLTYPRFLSADQDLMFSYRTGMAGLGSEILCSYDSITGKYTRLGIYLEGIENNPYINGLDFHSGRLHVTWTYRDFVPFDGWDKPTGNLHKRQAGPNGIENNHDLYYSYSDDRGLSWKNDSGTTIARLEKGECVRPQDEGIKVFEIPKGGGAHNQEDQLVDDEGGVHVLNRDVVEGKMRWKHYYRSAQGIWRQNSLPNVTALLGGKRGVMAVTKAHEIFFLLPANCGTNSGDRSTGPLMILKATKEGNYSDYKEVWKGGRFSSEPRVDRARLKTDGILSVYLRQEPLNGQARIVVVEFDLERR